jgi:hypothetical protein
MTHRIYNSSVSAYCPSPNVWKYRNCTQRFGNRFRCWFSTWGRQLDSWVLIGRARCSYLPENENVCVCRASPGGCLLTTSPRSPQILCGLFAGCLGSGPCVSPYLHANSILKWSVLALPNPWNWNTVVKLPMNCSPSNHFFCCGCRVWCVYVKKSFSRSIFQAPSFNWTD